MDTNKKTLRREIEQLRRENTELKKAVAILTDALRQVAADAENTKIYIDRVLFNNQSIEK